MVKNNDDDGSTVDDEELIDDAISDADKADSKHYRMFDYGNALTKAKNRVLKRHEDSKPVTPEKVFDSTAKQTKKANISMMTGADLGRINGMGKLTLKEGQKKAMAPSYEKLQKQLKNTESPYAMLLGNVGSKTGVEYGEQARRQRSMKRLRKLSNKLSSNNPIGSTENKKSGYGDAGTDIIKMFTTIKTRMMNRL